MSRILSTLSSLKEKIILLYFGVCVTPFIRGHGDGLDSDGGHWDGGFGGDGGG